MSYSLIQIQDIIAKADKTLYKIGSIAYEDMFSENSESLDYERDRIFIYKKAVEWADQYYVGYIKLDKIVERLASKLAIYDYGTLSPIYLDTIISNFVTVSGYIPSTRNITINGITQDLSVDRIWTVPNIYNSDGTLLANRTITANGFSLTYSDNKNGAALLTVSNTTVGTSSRAGFLATSINGSMFVGKASSTYVAAASAIDVNDTIILNSTNGDISIYNAAGGGRIKFTSNAANNPQMLLSQNGRLLVGSTTDTGLAQIQVTGAIQQSSVLSSLLKTNANGVIVSAVAGTDYVTSNIYTSDGTLTGNRTLFIPVDNELIFQSGNTTSYTPFFGAKEFSNGYKESYIGNGYYSSGEVVSSIYTGRNVASNYAEMYLDTWADATISENQLSIYTYADINNAYFDLSAVGYITPITTYFNNRLLIDTTGFYFSNVINSVSILNAGLLKLNSSNYLVNAVAGTDYVAPSRTLTINGTAYDLSADRSWTVAGGVTSVGLSMPSAFTVTSSPITSSGTLTVVGAGSVSQYIRGDGTLATLPSNTSGGSSVSYYLNGGTAASVATYYQMSKTAVIGTGVDFLKAGNGLISQFLTDVADPNRLLIPAGNWNFEMYMSASSSGGTPEFYVELLKYDGTTFTSIASSAANPESIIGGTAIDLYITSLAIPQTALLSTDRLAVRVYIVNSVGGRTITLHTQDSHLCEIITNFAGGVSALNGLTANTQYFAVGTGGTDFAISSATDTHTFNLPTASATNRGALSSADWTTFNSKFTLPSLTSGSVLFSNGTTIAQDNANFFWDNTNNRLGIGTASPRAILDIVSSASTQQYILQNNQNTNGRSILTLDNGAGGVTGGNIGFRSYGSTFAETLSGINLTGGALMISNSNNYNGPVAFLNYGIGTNSFMAFAVYSGEAMRIHSDKNVSIATTTNNGYKFYVNGTTFINAQANVARLVIGTTFSGGPQINIASGTAPTTSLDGDIWFDGTNLKMKISGVVSNLNNSLEIGNTITSATAGSVLFAGTSGVLAQDNANFFWDDTNNRLGIGTATPTKALEVSSDALINTLTIGTALAATSTPNMAIGYQALNATNTGTGSNTALGYQVLKALTTGYSNTSGGYQSMVNATTTRESTAFGYHSLNQLRGGICNTALGAYALFTTNSGGFNTALGTYAAYGNDNGTYNISIGYQSLYSNASGSHNIALGLWAGRYITGGTANTISDDSIYIGKDTRALANNQTNQIVIGMSAIGLGSNTTIIGNSSTVTTSLRGRLLLGTTTDAGTGNLQVTGISSFTGTTATDGGQLGSELTTTGSGTNWAGTDFATGYTHTTGSTVALTTSLAAVNGNYYQITYTITGRTTGTVTIAYGGISISGVFASSNSGQKATATTSLSITPTTDFNGTIVLSIKVVTVGSAMMTLRNSAGTVTNEIRSYDSSFYLGIGSGSYNTTGIGNAAIGYQALQTNTSGTHNTAIGYQALQANTSGFYNTAIGYQALQSVTVAERNVAIGFKSGYLITTGSGNVLLGTGAGQVITTGGGNFIGCYNAGQRINTGGANIAIGGEALLYVTSQGGNIAFGGRAGSYTSSYSNVTPSNSIYIGDQCFSGSTNPSNEIVIGNGTGTVGLGSNTTMIGSSSTVTAAIRGRLLLGTTTDSGSYQLDVNGTARVSGQLTVTGSTTAASAIARGANFTPTLVAAANSDVLVGLDIAPTFTNGAFTGVSNVGLRVLTNVAFGTIGTGLYWSNSNSRLGIGTNAPSESLQINTGNIVLVGGKYRLYNTGQNNYTDQSYSSNGYEIDIATVKYLTIFRTTGNLILQNGGTFTDAGYRLDVNGTARVSGDLIINGVTLITVTTNRQTASYTLVLSDRGKLVEMNVATANNLTIPLNSSVAFSIGTQIDIIQYGAGQTTVVATSGVTIRSTNSWLKLNAQYAAATLIKIATDEWYLIGNLNA